MRDEDRVLKICRKIDSIYYEVKNVDDSLCIDIEYTTSSNKNYTPDDYRIMLFNCLNKFEEYLTGEKKYTKLRKKLIKRLLERLSLYEVDLTEFEDDSIYIDGEIL